MIFFYIYNFNAVVLCSKFFFSNEKFIRVIDENQARIFSVVSKPKKKKTFGKTLLGKLIWTDDFVFVIHTLSVRKVPIYRYTICSYHIVYVHFNTVILHIGNVDIK